MTAMTESQPNPFLIVFGRDNAGKPHASWFDQASAELATKAAALMNMRAVPVHTDELRELVGSLPRGRVFSSGRAFTPFIKTTLYGRLTELTRDILGLTDDTNDTASMASAADATATTALPEAENKGPDQTSTGADTAAAVSKRPVSPKEIGVGSLVLATVGLEDGWWEAEVIGANGGMFTLKWRDYNEPSFVRRRSELGCLPPLSA